MFKNYRDFVDNLLLEHKVAEDALKKEQSYYDKTVLYQSDVKEASEVAQTVSEEIQKRAYSCIALTVSRCLEAVFDEPYGFQVKFVQKRGKVEVELGFIREGNVVDPMSASGGGVVDVAAFALRLASLLMLGKRGRKLLILDEPFKFVSAEYRSNLCELLDMLSDELGIQIIMVSHIEELRIGNVIKVG